MTPSDHVAAFWAEFLHETGRPSTTPLYHAGPFGDREESAAALARLVLRGRKVATTSLLREYELAGERIPRPGDLSVVTGWDGAPVAVIETTAVAVVPFEEVDEEFAAAEGEGDLSLSFWRKAHWAFFERLCAELGLTPSPDMPVVCERFRLVYPAPSGGPGPSGSVFPM